jgi:hypothetical protein
VGLSRRTKSVVLFVVVLLLINLPLAQSLASGYRLDHDSTRVTATLTDASVSGSEADPRYLLSARLPADVDSDETVVTARVDKAAYDAAVASKEVSLRVLPSRPSLSYRFDGQVPARTGLWLTLAADAVLAALVLLLSRTSRYRRRADDLRLEATAPVEEMGEEHGGHGVRDEEPAEGPRRRVLVIGQVLERTDHEVLIDAGGQMAWVVLDGHDCQVAVGDHAVARGRVLD